MSSLTEGRIGDERGFIHTRQVTWGDCDPAQIAYTGRIPNFGLEAIDAWWLHHTGFDWFRFQVERDFGTPFVHLDVDFRSPITPRHPLRSEVRLMHIGTTSLRFQVFGRQNSKLSYEGNYVCVAARISTLAKVPVPDDLRGLIAPLLDHG